MTSVLLYDTETTGIPLFGAPYDDPRQPHLVQLAAILVDADTRQPLAEMNQIIRPDGWEIPSDVAEIHGITTERALAEGVPLGEVLDRFWSLHEEATNSVAYNGAFDRKIMRIASLRHGCARPAIEAAEQRAIFHDPCRILTKIVNLPPTERMLAVGRKHAKTPKLIEAYRHLFGEDFGGAHDDAGSDVGALVRVFWWLVDQGHIRLEGQGQ